MPRVRLHSPLDMHLHLREGEMLQTVTPLSVQAFAGAVIMPNLVPPVTNRERLEHYRAAIRTVIGEAPFEPYMTLFFQPYDERTLRELREQIIGIKLYPRWCDYQQRGRGTGYRGCRPHPGDHGGAGHPAPRVRRDARLCARPRARIFGGL